jgi:hypothetical protein
MCMVILVTADYPNAIYHYHVTNSDPYINGNGYYGTQEQYLIRPFKLKVIDFQIFWVANI